MRVITVSRTFPGYHPKAGEPTYFVEKILAGLGLITIDDPVWELILALDWKYHTIRAGNRWKVGDMASLRYWQGKPRQKGSKQIEFAQVEIKKVFEIRIESDKDYTAILIDDWAFYEENKTFVTQVEALQTLAANDGLTVDDLKAWFKMPVKQPFTGQIICWSDKVNY